MYVYCTIVLFILKAIHIIIIIIRVPVEAKSSVCAISMKYRKMILIILSLSAWVKCYYRILQTHHAHIAVRWVGVPIHDGVNAPFSTLARQWPVGASFK